ncbi:hypothetical protein [Algoriphagus antarcticus]|uniref:Uncharacterized protein n=1 Tax=Algoriphagus antarcticus TaxID=238540 RepID=A0A3E0DXC3_9BACT|nr:hypothetical protein [Algoriphagus antarcticus]REG88520.1 hypothetical protein C8N25_109135 [Algoriphagus antarcticus]
MIINDQDNRFKVGDLVHTKVNSDVKMIVRKYYAKIYYCTFADLPMKKELALFERELVNEKQESKQIANH